MYLVYDLDAICFDSLIYIKINFFLFDHVPKHEIKNRVSCLADGCVSQAQTREQ